MSVKIGTFVRTRNEEKHIARFIETHAPFSDAICIADSGSTDKTLDIARQYPKVQIREFNQHVYLPDGSFYAHESQHYLFLHEWSLELGVDWAVFDDADHAPNTYLQKDARFILEHSPSPLAFNLLVYVWGTENYFPQLNACNPPERLWAWRLKDWQPQINPHHPTTVEITNQPQTEGALVMGHPPYCVLHFSWLDESEAQRKIAFNVKRGVVQRHPLESCGELAPMEKWMRIKE